eukprot:CAMPEP_0194305786 /NCGR_PEP_ID=MMETSP0171-20130528/3137_1 /TAXON_ID=218684 /ORGANISM="Corethron pennatum, Strain L29A3" /LENGTH=245 /DNA_ID=CAMNT_0039057411 /DNA_START=47 /DNA_END=784 /DNA_ORIENTATION=+
MRSAAILCLLLRAKVDAHYFWADVDETSSRVEVTFSEKAGVPDRTIQVLKDKLAGQEMSVFSLEKPTVAVVANLEDDRMAAPLPEIVGPAVVVGSLDYGYFAMVGGDLQYTFSTQIYREEADWTSGFFSDFVSPADGPMTILMNSCGPEGEFRIYGLPPTASGEVGVCVYALGGAELGCTATVGRDRTGGRVASGTVSVPLLGEDAILFALANITVSSGGGIRAGGGTEAKFASTSVRYSSSCAE